MRRGRCDATIPRNELVRKQPMWKKSIPNIHFGCCTGGQLTVMQNVAKPVDHHYQLPNFEVVFRLKEKPMLSFWERAKSSHLVSAIERRCSRNRMHWVQSRVWG